MRAELEKLADLTEGWDGHGGVGIKQTALVTADCIHFTPMSNGGILIEIHGGGKDIEIEIEPSGKITSVSIEG